MKNKMIKYVKNVEIEDGISLLSYGEKEVVSSATKAYHNTLFLLYRLPDNTKNLMNYLIEKMTEENIVHSNRLTRDNFNNSIFSSWFDFFLIEVKDKSSEFFNMNAKKLASDKRYKDSTINTAFGLLKKNGLLIQITRGVYRVNPEYFFKSSEAKRVDSIKMILELENGVDLIKIKTESNK